MRIRTQFIMTMLLFGAVVAAIATSVIVTNRRVETPRQQRNMATDIALGASELSYLANDYLIYQESQQLERWQSRFATFSGEVAGLQADSPEQLALIRNMQQNTQRLKDVFDSVASAVDPGGTIDLALLQVSWSRMAVQSQALASDASHLSQMLDDQVNQLRRTNTIVVMALIGVFGLYFVVNYLVVQKRALEGIAKLQAGTAVIGSGDLDYRIDEKRKDEIGELSHAFNIMTQDLKTVTTSKTDLETEIARRSEMEEVLELERHKLVGILNSMEDGVCIMNADFNITYINPSMKSNYGDVNGQKCYRYFNGGDSVCSWCNNEEVLAGKILKREAQSNRTGRTYEVTDAPLRNADGSVSKLAVFHDITERKKVEQLKDEFIGMVSHELKTPITVIMGAIYTAMTEGIPAEEARQLLEDAAFSTESLAGIVDNLLELSRAQTNRLMIGKEPLDMAQMAGRVAEKYRSGLAIHQVVIDIPAGLPRVPADRMRVERVLRNLIENAVKYSPHGGTITVFAYQQDDCLVVGVRDQGVGISAENQARLFRPFERLETADGVSGVGLGLITCRRLVEAHGGRIWVESEPGKGATFLFTLPLS